MKRAFLLAAALTAAMTGPACAYELRNHFDMSRAAVSKSVLGDPNTMKNLGWRRPADDFFQRFPLFATGFDTESVIECYFARANARNAIGCGAQFEDMPTLQVLNHFFDPANNIPLTVGGIRPGSVIGAPNLRSPDWALQDAAAEQNSQQQFAYRNARAYFHLALTSTDAATRDRAWGLMFQSLGHVIHHIQDMSQPEHVRNDAHCHKKVPCLIPLGFTGIYNPSLYEKLGSNNVSLVQSLASQASGGGIFPGPGDAYRSVFATPRAFFVGSGKGISEFTNRNFVSKRTNFSFTDGAVTTHPRYASPAPGPVGQTASMPQLYPAGVPPFIQAVCAADPANCFLTFYTSTVTDQLTGETLQNDRASTASIYDSDLESLAGLVPQVLFDITGGVYFTQRVFSVNDFNIRRQFDFLIPRAVGYSAGVINYFFRGKIELHEPDQIVLGAIDPVQSPGFSKVKLKLKNATPSENMTAGTLVAIAKFHRNVCYRPDLTGEEGAPGIDILACRSPFEETVVSVPKTDQTLVSGAQPLETTFDFSPPIPAGVTDLFLQVVFKGTLGSEPDAVAVTTVDLFEPTHIAFMNGTDLTGINDRFYTKEQIVSGIAAQDPAFDPVDANHDHVYNPSAGDWDVSPLNFFNLGLSFRSPGANNVGAIASLPPGRFSRLAVLTARPVLDFYPGPWGVFNPGGVFNQTDDAGTTFFFTPVQLFRGFQVYNLNIVFFCIPTTTCNGNLLDMEPSGVPDAMVPMPVTIFNP